MANERSRTFGYTSSWRGCVWHVSHSAFSPSSNTMSHKLSSFKNSQRLSSPCGQIRPVENQSFLPYVFLTVLVHADTSLMYPDPQRSPANTAAIRALMSRNTFKIIKIVRIIIFHRNSHTFLCSAGFSNRTPFLQASIYTVMHIKSTNVPDKTSKKLYDFLCLVRHYTTVYTKVLPAKPGLPKSSTAAARFLFVFWS